MNKIEEAFESFASLKNADISWDNVGVLIKNTENNNKKILLTIDLTPSVLQEAISKGIKYIIAYHPVIFKPINRITDDLYIKCIQNNIGVFCPHTALDDLMNSYLFSLINLTTFNTTKYCKIGTNQKNIGDIITLLKSKTKNKSMRVVFASSQSLSSIPKEICVGVGSASANIENFQDGLIVTGEMTHHNILKYQKNNCSIILMEHSSSERIFLPELKNILEKFLSEFEIFISKMDKELVEFK